MSIEKEVKVLTNALKEDEGYYYAWQANIAMAFHDECHRQGIVDDRIHDVANQAAKNFLNLFIGENNDGKT